MLALAHGLRAVLSVGCLLTLVLYIFGIVFTMVLADDAEFQDRIVEQQPMDAFCPIS